MTTASEVLTRALVELANHLVHQDTEPLAHLGGRCAALGDDRAAWGRGQDAAPKPNRKESSVINVNDENISPLDPEDLPADAWSLKRLDPDWETVPPEAAALDGQQVWIDGEPGTWCIVPGVHGHARRLKEGFYTDPDAPEETA